MGASLSVTRLTWLAVTAGVALVVGCGEGHAIFDVDVLSFVGGGGNDTIHYTFPGGTSGAVSNPPVKVSLLRGLGNSTVESVTLIVGADVDNDAGSGKVKYQVGFSSRSATVYADTICAPGSLCVKDSAIVSGNNTATLGPDSIPLAADSIFLADSIFVGVRLSVAANPPVAPAMNGRVRLTTVRLRIVLQDKIF